MSEISLNHIHFTRTPTPALQVPLGQCEVVALPTEVEEDDETRDLTAMVVVSPASTEGLFKIVTISRKRLQGEKMCDTNGSEGPRRRTVLCNATNAMGENYPAKKGSGGARGHNDSEGENKTREEEHRRAWETDGKRVWRNIPSSFTLQLSHRRSSRRGSSDASSCCGARSDMVVHDKKIVFREPASKDVEGGKEKTTSDLTNANVSSLRCTLAMASPTRENQGIGHHGSCLEEDEDDDTVPIRDDDTVPVQCEDGEEMMDVMDRNGANSTKLQVEYESRKELRWNRKRAELVGNIERWWVVVCHEINWDVNQPMPIIPPNINSPSSLVTAPRASFPPVLCS
ncbi:hypothetical protein TREMEDRAFT_64186 [Tremella mesenterica DSM 1558]|uniref:uncharacterized protein n=1 Tax=Tremella mesenterica (strain ATCC 24925 / CBS 8224 / DSM 1558 / NBRC 9311 / NRRL Y-6157 / RJB 2259-6 / UBC 559-6) TaxID=578456 RepID=UPI0003F48E85|nr:uncharacterized protein TREMEDRAFT_64186 [Tremella mesenterica DSM 1558]EIW67593.1 hypothetical protein TREMEDRAFT_64186 [Tremella mesenterica DSM 1558]